MKCNQCGRTILNEYDMVILNIDGDIACDKKCGDSYKKERDYFLNVVIHDDDLYSNWLGISMGDYNESMGSESASSSEGQLL